MSINSKMTAIADEIRTLSDTTEAMGLDAMANTLHAENTNFASNLTTQDDLIAQIQTALEGKASGGSVEPMLQDKSVTPSTSTQTVTPDSGYDGLSQVTINPIPSNYIVPSGTKTITTNGTHDVKSYTSATVNVASTGEDVTTETNAYTAKLSTLETAIAALETELEGKANGSGGGSGSIDTCTVVIQKDEAVPSDGYFDFVYSYLSENETIETGMFVGVTTDGGTNTTTEEDCGGLPLILNNVVCGSIMTFHISYGWDWDSNIYWQSDNGFLMNLDNMSGCIPIHVPTNPNTTETISIIYDGD